MGKFENSENNIPLRELINEFKKSSTFKRKKVSSTKKKKRKSKTKLTIKGEKYSKELVRKATPSELRFRCKLCYFNFNVKFQEPFNDKNKLYIADFYIPVYRLIIEIDGGYHNNKDQRAKDKIRDEWFHRNKIKVLRLTNHEADNITTEELSGIFSKCKKHGIS